MPPDILFFFFIMPSHTFCLTIAFLLHRQMASIEQVSTALEFSGVHHKVLETVPVPNPGRFAYPQPLYFAPYLQRETALSF